MIEDTGVQLGAAPGCHRGDTPVAATRGVLALVALLGRALLVLVVPASVVWIPLARVPGAGNVTVSDAALVALWGLVAVALLLRGWGDLRSQAPLIAVLAVSIAAFAGFGSSFGAPEDVAAFEFSVFMKRFGLAAILPLAAVLFRSRGTGAWMRLASAIAVAALTVFTLFPDLQSWLPRPDAWDDLFAGEGRAVGPLTNPNDLAYAATALAMLHAALLPGRLRTIDRALFLAVLAASATCVVSSGSRSGFLGVATGLAFLTVSSRMRFWNKFAVIAAGAAVFLAGITYSAVFENRLARAYRLGLQDENVYTRVDAQALAVRTAWAHPLGVGFTAFPRVTARTGAVPFTTSDSVYFDTLLGAGFLGLACLLWLLREAWRHAGGADAGTGRGPVLKAGIVAFLVFGAATVIPISVFLSPLFFSLVGAASYAGGDRAA